MHFNCIVLLKIHYTKPGFRSIFSLLSIENNREFFERIRYLYILKKKLLREIVWLSKELEF